MNTLVTQIERLSMRAWPALEEEWLDGWLLRAAQGYTGRANSVNPTEQGHLPVTEKIAHCEQWYASRKLPAKFRLNPFSLPADLDATLASRSYQHYDDVMVMTAGLVAERETVPRQARIAGEPVELSFAEWFAGNSSTTAPIQRAILERIQPMHWLAGWRCDGEWVARGLAVVDNGWLGIFNVSVMDSHRRRGFGRALMAAMIRQAVNHGARRAYLQVVAENAAAVHLYAGLGFHETYRYWYRILETTP
jgi:GNAT superfamily N-acetyltransferase